jgi:hypothetical protein
MKNYTYLIVLLLLTQAIVAQPTFELSTNIYRVPYAAGTDVHVTNDHRLHSPPGRYDMSGRNNGSSCSANYPIVAAAEGIIRRIEDDNNVSPPTCDPNCANFNNYVWIEHANGEWSKYSHMKQNSTTVTAGLQVGDQVCAGTLLGYECEVGQATGPHLHFEVRVPNDPNNIQISVLGGFMDDATHVIPVVNSISRHYFDADYDITASASTSCTNTDILLVIPYVTGNDGVRIYLANNSITTANNTAIIYSNGSNGMYQAGNSVTLSPGFQATAGSYFHARIGNCSTTGMVGTCQ